MPDDTPIDSLTIAETAQILHKTEKEIAALKVVLEKKTSFVAKLSRRVNSLLDADPSLLSSYKPIDRRKIADPNKNLKITAAKAMGHAVEAGATAEGVHARIMEAVRKRHGSPHLPRDVVKYIDALKEEYAKVGHRKKKKA